MTNPQSFVLAACAQVLLTVAVLAVLGSRRRIAFRAGQHGKDALLNDRSWPDDVLKASNNYKSQFEIPLLFFAAVAIALSMHAVTVVLVWLAWGFVAARVVHCICHCGPNTLHVRFASFLTGVVAVLIMWVMLASHVFSTGTS